MGAQTLTPAAQQPASTIQVRKIGAEDLSWSLRAGWQDFMAMRGDLLFVGILYPLIGLAAAVMTTNGPLMPFFLPIVAGVGLLGPIAAIGFYELARRREDGLESGLGHFLDVRKRPAAEDLGMVGTLLLGLFALWLLAAGALYVALFGWATPTSITGFIGMIFTTPRGWALIVAGGVVGAVFGWLVLALSVASMPLLVDCDVGAGQAVSASWRAAHANAGLMFRWGLTVASLLVLGSIPLFIGLAAVLPWLGYSTWHLYTRLIDRQAIPREACE
jgi:uncharacterized membrane protein